MQRTAGLWLLIGLAGYALLPWYMVAGGFWSFAWLGSFTSTARPALLWALSERYWLFAPLAGFAIAAGALLFARTHLAQAKGLVAGGAMGLVLLAAQGLIILGRDTRFGLFEGATQPGMGAGALLVAAALLFLLTTGISGLGRGRGDAFITGMIGAVVALVGVFVFYPMVYPSRYYSKYEE
jgi:iron(III) transport system permease protein